MTCSYLSIPFTEHNIDLFKNEQSKAWFKKLNPKCEVPVLEDAEVTMPESLDICKYLIETRKIEGDFYPLEEEKRVKVEKDLERVKGYADFIAKVLFEAYIGPAVGVVKNTKKERKEMVEKCYEVLDKFEKELEKRGTRFYTYDRKDLNDMINLPTYFSFIPGSSS